MKTGLSLSACVADIALGRTKESEVIKIISRISAPTKNDMKRVLDYYAVNDWTGLKGAREIAERLIEKGLVEQPRLIDPSYHHSIHDRIWIEES